MPLPNADPSGTAFPIVAFDFMFLSAENDGGEVGALVPHLVGIDRNARYPWAMVMADKAGSDGRAVKGFVQFLDSLGHRDVVLM